MSSCMLIQLENLWTDFHKIQYVDYTIGGYSEILFLISYNQ
jgi:hypothetical protein